MNLKPPIQSVPLVDPLGRRLDDQLAAGAEDLRHAQVLLNAAVCELLTCIQDPAGEGELAAPAACDETVSARMSELLTKLQFEDMVTQLLRRAEFRVASLRLMVAELAHELVTGGAVDPTARSSRCRQLIDQHLRQLELSARDSIKQSDMRPGDVDLF